VLAQRLNKPFSAGRVFTFISLMLLINGHPLINQMFSAQGHRIFHNPESLTGSG
jgi:hypothetical protein